MNMKNIKGRRMPFENEIQYTRELMENHPDPSAEWSGGSGSEYEAGTGIDITEESGTSTISIDNTVALKEDIITSYNDLTDKPTIGAGTITIQANGVDVDSFSVNRSTNKTINIPVSGGLDIVEITATNPYDTGGTITQDQYNTLLNNPEAVLVIGNYLVQGGKIYLRQLYNDTFVGGLYYTGNAQVFDNVNGPIAGQTTVYLDGTNLTWEYQNESVNFAKVSTTGDYNDLSNKPSIPSTATSTSTVTPTTSAFVTGTSTTTETLTFTYSDNTTATITIVTSVTDSTSNAMTGASVSTTTTLS